MKDSGNYDVDNNIATNTTTSIATNAASQQPISSGSIITPVCSSSSSTYSSSINFTTNNTIKSATAAVSPYISTNSTPTYPYYHHQYHLQYYHVPHPHEIHTNMISNINNTSSTGNNNNNNNHHHYHHHAYNFNHPQYISHCQQQQQQQQDTHQYQNHPHFPPRRVSLLEHENINNTVPTNIHDTTLPTIQQQQQQQQVLSLQPPPPPKIQQSLSSSLSNNEDHQYIVLKLQRPTLQCLWGLTIAYQNGIIFINNVTTKTTNSHNHENFNKNNNDNNNTLLDDGGSHTVNENDDSTNQLQQQQQQQQRETPKTTYIKEYYITNSWITPTNFFHLSHSNHKVYQPYQDHTWFRNHLLQQQQQPPPKTTSLYQTNTTLQHPNTILRPGDCIVQIIPTSSSTSTTTNSQLQCQKWDSLQSFLKTLQEQRTNTIQLIIYRNPDVANINSSTNTPTTPLNTTSINVMNPTLSSSLLNCNDTSKNNRTSECHSNITLTAFHILATKFPILKNNIKPKVQQHHSFVSSSAKRKLFHDDPKNQVTSAIASASVSTKILPMNHLFVNPNTGKNGVQFDDDIDSNNNDMILSMMYEPNQSSYYVSPITNVMDWIQTRKQQWRQNYNVYKITVNENNDTFKSKKRQRMDTNNDTSIIDMSCRTIPIDFWSHQGYTNFQQWLQIRKVQWYKSYSWNQQKRYVLEQDLLYNTTHTNQELLPITYNSSSSTSSSSGGDSTGTIPRSVWDEWIRVRKNQWKILRRKRQRRLLFASKSSNETDQLDLRMTTTKATASPLLDTPVSKNNEDNTPSIPIQNTELMVIDAILEEQEKQERYQQSIEQRQISFDISFVFDSTLGCPDDVVANILLYMPVIEHYKLLCINRTTRVQLQQRHMMWKQLIPSHWTIPRRPRKTFQELYTSNLRIETERKRKLWDDLLSKASNILLHGDQVQAIEKLINEAQARYHHYTYRYDIDYVSGVVCERNSILNLAVIHQRFSTYIFLFCFYKLSVLQVLWYFLSD
jgi:hypothetical protein